MRFSVLRISIFAFLSSLSAVAAPKRVVPLLPSLAEIAVAVLGGDDEIVGVTEYTDYPKSLAKKTSVGPYSKPNVETIVSLKPDLVLASEDGSPKETVARLKKLGIPVVSVGTESLAKTRSAFLSVGVALGRKKEGEAALAKFDAEIASIRKRSTDHGEKRGKLRVLLEVGDDPLVVVGGESFLHEGLEILGVQNVYGDVKATFPRVSFEDALRRNPDSILLVALSDDLKTFERARTRWMAYPNLSAARRGDVRILRSDSLVRPGPRFPAGLAELESALFPEATK